MAETNEVIRVLMAKGGLDGHDRGVKVIARALRDSGVHVIYSGLWQTPRSLAISARDEDVDVIAASMMSNSHLILRPKLLESLKALGRPELPVYMGGILPQEDLPKLLEMGIGKCFTTGSSQRNLPCCTSPRTNGVPLNVATFTASRLPVMVIAGTTNCDMLS